MQISVRFNFFKHLYKYYSAVEYEVIPLLSQGLNILSSGQLLLKV